MSAIQMRLRPSTLSGLICSCRTVIARMNWMVGPRYCTMPMTESGRALVAAAKSMRGTTVTTPVDARSQKCPAPSLKRVICPCAFSTSNAAMPRGARIKVSRDSEIIGLTSWATRALSRP